MFASRSGAEKTEICMVQQLNVITCCSEKKQKQKVKESVWVRGCCQHVSNLLRELEVRFLFFVYSNMLANISLMGLIVYCWLAAQSAAPGCPSLVVVVQLGKYRYNHPDFLLLNIKHAQCYQSDHDESVSSSASSNLSWQVYCWGHKEAQCHVLFELLLNSASNNTTDQPIQSRIKRFSL